MRRLSIAVPFLVILLGLIGHAAAATPLPLSSPNVNPEPAEGAAYFGALDGAAVVSAAGNAAYSIPIEAPPGRRGLAPNLAIKYNSNVQNGLLGAGWFISGLSKITRCPRTLAHEGLSRPIKYDQWDRYCLDGHRLFAVSGYNGADGSYYRTEIDGISTVQSHGFANGPLSFTVKTKDGLVMEYGATADSRAEASTTSNVRTWALNKVSDAAGNAYHLHYVEVNSHGRHYIDRITYNAAVSVSGGVSWGATDTEIKFVYESRADNITQYEGGTYLERHTFRLARIESSVDGQIVSKYRLDYEEVGVAKRSRITRVRRCDGTGSCQDPITMEWQHTGTPSFTAGSMTVPTFVGNSSTYASAAATAPFDYNVPRWHDMNGDGKPDYVHPMPNAHGHYPSSNMTFRIMLSTPTGYTTQDWPSHIGGHPKDFHWVDIDGNGTTDIVKVVATTGVVDAALSTGSGFTSGSPYDTFSFAVADAYRLADMNGDGLIDIVKFFHSNATNPTCPWSSLCPPGPKQIKVTVHKNKGNGAGFYWQGQWIGDTPATYYQLVDLNGDGLVDLHTDNRYMYRNTGSSFSGTAVDYTKPPGIYGVASMQDYNADGLIDRKAPHSDGTCCRVELNRGNRFGYVAANGVVANSYIDDNPYTDGYQRTGPGRIAQVSYATESTYVPNPPITPNLTTSLALNFAANEWGNGYSPLNLSYSGTHLGGFHQWADINGDGLMDLTLAVNTACKLVPTLEPWFTIYFRTDTYHYCETGTLKTLIQNGHPYSLLKKITQGRGVRTIFTYKPLTDSNVYTKGSSATFPDYDIQDTTYVVSRMTQSNGIGGLARVDYQYEGLVRNVQGRGDKGFAKITAKNVTTGINTVTEYAQAFPYTSQPTRIETRRASDNQLLSSSDITYSMMNTVNSYTKLPYVNTRVEKGYALSDGRLLSTKTTTNSQVDVYGNIGVTNVLLEDHETGTNVETERTTTFNIDASWTYWRVGEVASVSNKTWLNGINDPSEDRFTTYTYAPATGFLLTETIEPGAGVGIESTRTLTYDAVGNVIAETVSGPGIASRTTTTTYDSDYHFPISVTNALGHVASQTWDDRFGNKLSETDVNGQTTTWSYNSFGMQILETRPDGTTTQTVLFTCTAATCGPIDATSYVESLSSGQAPTRTYFDQLGRTVRQRTQAFNGNYVNTDTEYDTKGRAYRTSEPYFAGGAVHWNTQTFDLLNRVTAITAADSVNSVSTSYDGFTVTTTDAVSRSEVRAVNALGQIIQVTDKAGTLMTFAYDAVGNRVTVNNAVGTAQASSVQYVYDRLGRLLSQSDPDHGLYTYTYDALGNKLSEVSPKLSANSQSITYQYDQLNRMTSRTEPEGTTVWSYDDTTGGNLGLGKVASESMTGFSRSYNYGPGNYGRLTGTDTTIGTSTYATAYTYDSLGRVAMEFYPSSVADPGGFVVEYEYSPVGHLEAVQSLGGGTVFYQLLDTDAAGRVTSEWLGDGSTVSQSYAGQSSRIASQSSLIGPTSVQEFTYTYDGAGNMLSRSDVRQSITESFTFDNLDRMTSAQVGANPAVTYGFDAMGSITANSDVGSPYLYTANPKHAVNQILSGGSSIHTFGYDANGNMDVVDGSPMITWSSYNKPTQISSGGVTYQFAYGTDRKRFKKIRNAVETHYVGSNFEATDSAGQGVDHFRHYIRANGKVVAIREDDNGTVSNHFVHRDHLGSVTALTDQLAGVTERFSFNAWGARRSAVDWTSAAPATDEIRGYTGHEHLDDVGIIHMNGRVYSPTLARMLSPDPVTQALENGQNYNRYTYVYNNPLKYTDPSGYEPCLYVCSMAASYLIQGISDVLFGSKKKSPDRLFRDAALSWCGSNAECKRERLGIKGRTQQWNFAKAEFGNFLAAASAESGDSVDGSGVVKETVVPGSEEAYNLFVKRVNELFATGELSGRRTYGSPDEAAIAILTVMAPLSVDYGFEVAGSIKQHGRDRWVYTKPKVGTAGTAKLNPHHAGYHTHIDGALVFSNKIYNYGNDPRGGDSAFVNAHDVSLYLGVFSKTQGVRIGVCEPKNCRDVGMNGTKPSRILR
ncbi:RHS repeat-associated core domain-containing protein [Parahalioglobus pacificus]|uniref:Insecticide toxin TcdB middle/N-terminal domain-containing protein n=1 Tax=Parahalioglobus pacificus TaxID=930806 RepID=A0A919CIY2_9GAMM|nr:RHS repeat-associated core domain-containing protein [Halioglobus pacificus]GHD29546.1 hypothetical protein GCM10007053_10270 [Halioglobus pacificus]